MKLYTEEQVRETIKLSRNVYKEGFPLSIEEILKKLIPKDFPSDEKIANEAKILKENVKRFPFHDISFQYGAKWMKEQILNQNK